MGLADFSKRRAHEESRHFYFALTHSDDDATSNVIGMAPLVASGCGRANFYAFANRNNLSGSRFQ